MTATSAGAGGGCVVRSTENRNKKKTRQVPAKLESTGVERPPPPHVKIESSERVRVKVRVSHDQADQLTMVRLFFGCSENTNGGGHASESEGI